MAKSSTRRSISVKGVTYRRLQILCKEMGVSISGYCEKIIKAKMDGEGIEELKERPLILWECTHGSSSFLVAARGGIEAANYVVSRENCRIENLTVGKFKQAYNPTVLIPGILVPDEQRAALTG